jgi:hypothetical protein
MTSTSGLAAEQQPEKAAQNLIATTAMNDNSQPLALDAAAPAVAAPAALPVLTAPPAAPSALITLKQRPETHRFFDVMNSFALSAVAASLTADALSTQKGLSYPGFYEINPVARPFVKTRAGAAAYSAASLGLVAGGMYLAHRTHRHKLERILPFAVAGWEGLLSVRNYRVIAARTR